LFVVFERQWNLFKINGKAFGQCYHPKNREAGGGKCGFVEGLSAGLPHTVRLN